MSDIKLETLCWDWCEGEEDYMRSWAADFETTTTADDCRVWAWAASAVDNPDFVETGNDMDTFMEWLELQDGCRVLFHNLKFDGKFILSWLFAHGWCWVPDKDSATPMCFTTLISDMGQWYQMQLWFPEAVVTIQDSLKVINLSVARIPKAFGLPIEKLDMDYEAPREVGHVLTPDEEAYIAHDVKIVAMALNILYEQGMNRMTTGSNAFADYKDMLGGEDGYRSRFPLPSYDADLREGGCYKGGFTAANPRFAGSDAGCGISFDVNSLYPSVMASAHGEVLPYGEPVPFAGEYAPIPGYPLYIQYFEADFTVKEDHIPCLQLKHNTQFGATEYIRDSHGTQLLCLTNVDMELFFEQYDVHDIRYIRGYAFRGSTDLFKGYVDKWTTVKTQATLDGNDGLRTIAKLQLNSLYGKLATNPVKRSKRPFLDENTGIVRYAPLPEEHAKPQYLPAAAFVTSYARAFTIRASQRNYDRWLYSDTDSCYLRGTEPPEGMEVDPVKLGAWKQEHSFDRFKALRAKTYVFEEGGHLYVTCAGMPSRCHSGVTFDNFEVGASFEGKLKPVDVKGGTILVDEQFTIKP